jgi:hypothetical protein
MEKYHLLRVLLARLIVPAMLIPCFLEFNGTACAQVRFEVNKCIGVRDVGFGNDVLNNKRIIRIAKFSNLIGEGGPESSSGFVELCNLNGFDTAGASKPMIYEGTKQIAKHAASGECENIGNCDHQILLILGFNIGSWTVIIFYALMTLLETPSTRRTK